MAAAAVTEVRYGAGATVSTVMGAVSRSVSVSIEIELRQSTRSNGS